MSARDELRERIRAAIEAAVLAESPSYEHSDAELAAGAVMHFLGPVRRMVHEMDVTTLGDAERQMIWARYLHADLEIPIEGGRYAVPHHGAWECLP